MRNDISVCVCPVGKLPYGFLDNNAGGAGSGVMGGLDSASLEKQLALSAAFGGAAGLAAFGGSERVEVYSRKVFVGGLPPDIDEGTASTCPYFTLLSNTICLYRYSGKLIRLFVSFSFFIIF